MAEDEPRQLDWARFRGAFANAAKAGSSDHPVLGVAADICPCCDERYVVIAAVHHTGFEISVSLAPAEAVQFANTILTAYAKVATTPHVVRQ